MLRITVASGEAFDEEQGKFVELDPVVLEFEHSLVSLSKWEEEHEKPFLNNSEKTSEETFSYIKAMLLTPNVSEETLKKLTKKDYDAIGDYINAKRTATWFRETSKPPFSKEVITSELIYYWMIAMNIPFECQHWHLARLITLIRVCNEKNAPKKKGNKAEWLAQRRALNDQRRAQYGTTG